MMQIPIKGSSVMITGGCGAIGLAMARLFLEQGKRAILVDRNISGGAELQNSFPNVERIECDLADEADIERQLSRFRDSPDCPEILINNVGASPKYHESGERIQTWTMTSKQWNDVMAINATSYFLCSKLVLPSMLNHGYGRIINTASYAARTGGYQPAAHYVASKAAVLGLTKALAKEVSSRGINVNAINPGRIATPMTQDVSDEVNKAVIPQIALRRFGQPMDIASVALFLASELADYLTGTAIEVNGGLYMGP
jgi:3-oxoacyl-[acyl-carrier protein] reductase